jgi:hypothetical protein
LGFSSALFSQSLAPFKQKIPHNFVLGQPFGDTLGPSHRPKCQAIEIKCNNPK